jgi:carbon-monoxide dehydrogenase large subunit
LVGKATYVDDIRLPDTLHLAFVRSTRAHARITRIGVDTAHHAQGVHGVFTGADIAKVLKPIGKPYSEKVFPPSVCHQPKWPCLAIDKVRYVGEAIVAVLAESRYLAEDAAELVDVDYEELPAIMDAEEALKPGAPLIHEEFDSNMMVHVTGGGGDVDAAFRDAALVVHERFHTNRHMGCALEGRATLAKFDSDGDITLWSSNQMPHMLRTRVADIMGFPEHKLRVIAPDVGGGFGPKAFVYPEDVLTCYFARSMKRPVKWTEDRREHLLGTFHAKEDIIDCEMSFSADGTVLGIRAKVVQDLGAYCADPWPSPFEGLQLAATLEGPYKIRGYAYEVSTAWTNKMTSAAYRGVGHVPAVYLQEHMMDLAARQLRMDPIELRLKNMIRPEEFPYVTLTGLNYDSGSSTEALKKAANILGYEDFRKRQLQARSQGRYILSASQPTLR